ncbi:helix-turn-helix domain-containing protein [Nocardioides sp. WG-D5]
MAAQPTEAPEQASTIHLLSIEEAATYLNVPQRWVADAVRQRRIRCSRIGKHVRFRLEHLDEFISACEQPLTAPSDTKALHLGPKASGRSRL